MFEGKIFDLLRQAIREVAPTAQAWVYGSWARGEQREDSDIDLLILVDQPRMTPADEDVILNPLYDIEFQQGVIISPLIMTNRGWSEVSRKSFFYYNVMDERQPLWTNVPVKTL